ncbi:MAG: hypothetical protein R2728_13085 [Chitinophagales bacterium]
MFLTTTYKSKLSKEQISFWLNDKDSCYEDNFFGKYKVYNVDSSEGEFKVQKRRMQRGYPTIISKVLKSGIETELSIKIIPPLLDFLLVTVFGIIMISSCWLTKDFSFTINGIEQDANFISRIKSTFLGLLIVIPFQAIFYYDIWKARRMVVSELELTKI